jgi:hypothetical protein
MTIWYVARGSGFGALILLTAAACLGTLMSGRVSARPDTRFVTQHAHRAVATTALAVLGVHVVAILADSYAHVGALGTLLPFASRYRPLWVGLGCIATYLVLLAATTGYLRPRLARSPRAVAAWRALHAAAYAGWALAMLHGLRSGTDTNLPWVRWIYLGCLAAVAGSVAVRFVAATPRDTASAAVTR